MTRKMNMGRLSGFYRWDIKQTQGHQKNSLEEMTLNVFKCFNNISEESVSRPCSNHVTFSCMGNEGRDPGSTLKPE